MLLNIKQDASYNKTKVANEQMHYNSLMKTINERMKKLKSEAPDLYKHIEAYQEKIQKQSDILNCTYEENKYACTDLCAIDTVTKRKNEIFEEFVSHQNWKTYCKSE